MLSTLGNYWAKKGWEVTVATMTSSQSDFYALDERITRCALNLATESGNPISGLFNNIKRVMAVRKLLHDIKPDVAISMMTTANILLALASIGKPGLVTVGSERTHPPNAIHERFWKFARRYTYGRLSSVVALSKESGKWLREHTNAQQIVTIPNPVTWPLPVQLPTLKPTNKPSGQYRLLTVGRLSPEKGYDLLIKTFSQLVPQFPNWQLVIVGDGQQRDQLQAQITDANLTTQVLLPGRCGNLATWYESADLYVLSSRFEGFPNTVVEAMSHGVPVVSYDCVTGPREIIRHNIDGVLVAPENIAELTLALGELMRDPVKREKLAARATDVKTRFAIENVTQQWRDLFQKLGVPAEKVNRGFALKAQPVND